MDPNAASRNAFGEDAAKFEAEVDRYYNAGVFNTSAAPNRPINPDRDFNTTFLASDEGDLMRADLLTPASAALYESLLKSGKDVAEANEGLALLAMRDNDVAAARAHMEAARTAGTRNFVALTQFARLETDPNRAIDILKEALSIDPKYAEAHWTLGEKLRPRPGVWPSGSRLWIWRRATTSGGRNTRSSAWIRPNTPKPAARG